MASEIHLGIGHVFWLRAYVFVESISDAGMHESFGTVLPAGISGEMRERCRASVNELEARRHRSVFLFVSLGVCTGIGETQMEYDGRA